MQYTGAYKVRGAFYKISTRSDEGETARSDHPHRLETMHRALHTRQKLAGCKATVVMPTTTPLMKVKPYQKLWRRGWFFTAMYSMRRWHMQMSWQLEHGYTFYPSVQRSDVATGQGTIAMEIIKELPTVDYILVPIGGGGLCTGVATLAKLLNPKIKVIGVEPAGANCMQGIPERRKSSDSSRASTQSRMVLPLNARAICCFRTSRSMWMISSPSRTPS